MRFLKNIFAKKDKPIKNYADFWAWFQKKERRFFNVLKNETNIDEGFFDELSLKLAALKNGYFFVAGMFDENTAELVFTADGNTKNIVFVEELVAQAPKINGWKFTALKPALRIEDVSIRMAGLSFHSGNLFFYSNELPNYPDEIDIYIIYDDLTSENKKDATTGIYIFLDNYLGELDFLNNIDRLRIISRSEAQKELVPINKLKDFLIWRQKEFMEKYDGVRYGTENDCYATMEAEFENGNRLVALLNTTLLKWDGHASYPWLAIMTIKYDGSNHNGMPNNEDYENMNNIEEEMASLLTDKEGCLNIGRQTANGEREIYFACKDFRKPSKVFYEVQQKYGGAFEMEYEIYKDKYWQTLDRFIKCVY